jgi:hypothetical protein
VTYNVGGGGDSIGSTFAPSGRNGSLLMPTPRPDPSRWITYVCIGVSSGTIGGSPEILVP